MGSSYILMPRSRPSRVIGSTISAGDFQTPDTLNEASFEVAGPGLTWDGFTHMDGVHTPTSTDGSLTRDNTQAAPGGGSWSVRRTWAAPSSDAGTQFGYYLSTNVDRIWLRLYYRQTAVIDSIMKFQRWGGDAGAGIGGLFLEADPSIGFAFDIEDNQHNHPIGVNNASPLDGNWHSIEYDFWRNGDPSGFPSIAFWWDGQPSFLSDRTLTGGATPAFWSNGRLNAGERNSTQKLSFFECLATINGGTTTTGQINIDRFCMSSLGRIGP